MRGADDVTRRVGTSTLGESFANAPAPAPGDTIGRYRVVLRIGQGGMGTVYAAIDPELQRRVAIKILRAAPAADFGSGGRAVLLREAQALARLAHPNVIEIYDVGLHRDDVFIAMELAEGPTLATWLDANRTWRETLAAFVSAGRGLAAAHAAGLVHHDFKPGNVVVDLDGKGGVGRVRVLDFGLAVAEDTTTVDSRDGTVVGTPAYMAPEQRMGTPTDARCDQFSFCVALYCGLYGTPPFPPDAPLETPPRPPPPGRGVPARYWPLLRRGLNFDAAARYGSMDELLSALAPPPRRTGTHVALALAAGGVLGAGLLAGDDDGLQIDPCGAALRRAGQAWTPQVSIDLRAALADGNPMRGIPAGDRVVTHVDRYVAAWTDAHRQACAPEDQTDPSGALERGLQVACLGERLDDLHSTIDVVLEGAGNVDAAVTAIASLPPIATCSSMTQHSGATTPDAMIEDEVAEYRSLVARANALLRAGRVAQAIALLEPEIARIDSLGYAPIYVDAVSVFARALAESGAFERALSECERGYAEARAAGYDKGMIATALQLVLIAGNHLRDSEVGFRWAREAETAIDRAGRMGTIDEAMLRRTQGVLHERAGNQAAAQASLQSALALRSHLLGPDHPSNAVPLTSLGVVAHRSGDFDEAIALTERALVLYAQDYGADHPVCMLPLSNLGAMHTLRGDHEAAEPLLRRVFQISETQSGLEHPDTILAIRNLGILHEARGRYDEAIAAFEQAYELQTRATGPDHPEVAMALNSIGVFHRDRGDYAEARRHLERARLILAPIAETEANNLATVESNVADVLTRLGEHDAAVMQYRSVLESMRARLGAEHPEIVGIIAGLCGSLIELGRAEEALPLIEHAVRIGAEHRINPVVLASARFGLARALYHSGGDVARADAVAAEAIAGVHDLPPPRNELVGEVEQWLAGRGSTADP